MTSPPAFLPFLQRIAAGLHRRRALLRFVPLLLLALYLALTLQARIIDSDDTWTVVAVRETGWLTFPLLMYQKACGWFSAVLTQYTMFSVADVKNYYGLITLMYMLFGGACAFYALRRTYRRMDEPAPSGLLLFALPVLLILVSSRNLRETFYHVSSSMWTLSAFMGMVFFSWLVYPPPARSAFSKFLLYLVILLAAVYLGFWGLTTTVIVNGLLFFGVVEAWAVRRESRYLWTTAFVAAFIAGCFCLLAPGNFHRAADVHAAGGHMGPIGALAAAGPVFIKMLCVNLGYLGWSSLPFLAILPLLAPTAASLAARWNYAPGTARRYAAAMIGLWFLAFVMASLACSVARCYLFDKSYAFGVMQLSSWCVAAVCLPFLFKGFPSVAARVAPVLRRPELYVACVLLFSLVTGRRMVRDLGPYGEIARWARAIDETDRRILAMKEDQVSHVVLPALDGAPPRFLEHSFPRAYHYWDDYYELASLKIGEDSTSFVEGYFRSRAGGAQERIRNSASIRLVHRGGPLALSPGSEATLRRVSARKGERLYVVLEAVSRKDAALEIVRSSPRADGPVCLLKSVRTERLPPEWREWDVDYWRIRRGQAPLKAQGDAEIGVVLLKPDARGEFQGDIVLRNGDAEAVMALNWTSVYAVDENLTLDRFLGRE